MFRRKLLSSVVIAAGLVLGTGLAEANDALVKASKDPNSWIMWGGGYENQRYSPLDQINTENVKNLKVAFMLSLGSLRSQESTPIVIGDTMYVSSSWGPKHVFAVDARTGKLKWDYEPEVPEDVLQFSCCDVNSRGVSYGDGRIYVTHLDGHVAALDAKTGKEIWKTKIVDYKQGSTITSPALVVKNLVISGYAGGEYGARGSIVALDSATGKEVWRTWTIPGPNEPGNETWKGDSWKTGGGTVWMPGSYDPETNTVFFGTSNPSPWAAEVRGPGTSDYGKFTNLYTSSTLALDADSGKIKWWVQHTPHDAWDYDGVNELVLADLNIGGTKTPVFMKADRNGFFYVVNRKDGKIVSATPFVDVNWASGIDLATGRPKENPEKRPSLTHKAKDICPNLMGGKNWHPMAFNPNTGLVYIPGNNMCMDLNDVAVEYKRGFFYLGKEFDLGKVGAGGVPGETIAWDPVAGKKVWSHKEELPYNGGMLTTAGNLVFHGTLAGEFKAFNAKTGEVLFKLPVGSGVGAGPMTYSIDGKQYVAVVVGRTASIPPFYGEVGKKMASTTPEGGMLIVFSL